MNAKLINLLLLAVSTVAALSACRPVSEAEKSAFRVIHADVVALDHDIYFNRFGSHDPYGMIYALKRDVVSKDGKNGELQAGKVRLRSDKRARPLAIRVNAGDILEITFTNLLSRQRPHRHPDDVEAADEGASAPIALDQAARAGNAIGIDDCKSSQSGKDHGDAPATRCATIALSGLPLAPEIDGKDPLYTGLQGIAPGEKITYRWKVPEKTEGTFLFSSLSAPAGGEGDGGSLVHGLFGTVTVEPKDSRWYRSAVKSEELAAARKQARAPALLNYEATDSMGDPILNMLKPLGDKRFELIYSPLNAIIVESGHTTGSREFTVVFHDELKTVYRPEFQILGTSKQLSGVRDGFAINYGASGLGSILLANRLGIGPAKNCVDCLFEEFFLQSWANGDPALLLQNPDPELKDENIEYLDDPSNVHHSYLGDPVRFRNAHVGPKETHVFHLHAHQWESSKSGYANYLDSQTIAPQLSFTYNIAHNGSGNRNLSPGDSILHCHLYPHFAQGMWALWRVHDVFEDGTRRLPDGELPDGKLGKGTDPETGVTESGTPIPALVPLPGLAIAPEPTYPKNPKIGHTNTAAFPGYPFYIPGKPGHRVPQPPLDIVENGGLGRHIVSSGVREFTGGKTPVEQFANADLTAHFKKVSLTLFPDSGTDAEKAAMEFHAKREGYASKTPEGYDAVFRVNGKPPRPGAPYADPCGEDPDASIRRYRASVIDLDIQTNEHGWHDPQSRINVLDKQVARFENKKTKDAEPFFFRVESGECVEFLHTNRTDKALMRDDFQVATPTDIIGQHIHLVKFDVTSSDGSANGFNYQDGTYAWDAIKELSEASRLGEVRDYLGKVQPKPKAKTDKEGGPIYQTTIQRWWADSHNHKDGDGTLGTVFTHDHFAPSSIQQHGFYNAMLVEPKGSVWRTPDGTDMKTGKRADQSGNEILVKNAMIDIDCKAPITEPERRCRESFAVGSRGMVVKAEDQKKHPDTREFALAIADFALLYDQGQQTGPEMPGGMIGKIGDGLAEDFAKIRKEHGYPVDPPFLPEAISTDHHNPYLINYKHEPIPLRIGERGQNLGKKTDFSSLLPRNVNCTMGPHLLPAVKDKWAQDTLCNPADFAYVFSSHAPHGDPFLKPFRAYEGDKVQFRIIQGAQEVQHSFTVHGLSWKRERHNPDAPYINAQEIGISEHFEMDVLNLGNIGSGLGTADYLFNFGTQDDLWNGSWGLLRAFASPDAYDPANCEDKNSGILKVGQADFIDASAPDRDADEREDLIKKVLKSGNCEVKTVSKQQSQCREGGRVDDTCGLAVLSANSAGKVKAINAGEITATSGCPVKDGNGKPVERIPFVVEAWQAKDLLGDQKGIAYDADNGISDADALLYVLENDRIAIQEGRKKSIEPLVLRAPTGSCIELSLINKLPPKLDDGKGDALMPKITSINVDSVQQDGIDATPSSLVSMHPQLVAMDVLSGDGAVVGFNPTNNAIAVSEKIAPGTKAVYRWYPGRVELEHQGQPNERLSLVKFKKPTVAGLTSYGDVIGQGSHGLIGALVIEPEKSEIYFADDFSTDVAGVHGKRWDPRNQDSGEPSPGLSAVVVDPSTKKYAREFVVFYQDGINLQKNNKPVPDCRICDDSYDLGEKGVNYRSAPFLARLGLDPMPGSEQRDTNNLNDIVFPKNFFDPGFRPFPFKDFKANAGETLRFHVLQPSGRGRQRTFQLYGHQFKDDIPGYGTPWSRLIAPGIAYTAEVEHAKPGNWLYRDGPAHIFAGGSWGRLVVEP